MSNADIKENIEYLKTMAEQGSTTSVLGGIIGLWWCSLACVALFLHFLTLKGLGPLEIDKIGIIWLGFGIIGGIGSIILARRTSQKPGAHSSLNKVMGVLWIGISIFIFAYAISLGFSAGLGRIGFQFFDTIIPLAFGLSSLAAFVTSQMSQEKWQINIAIMALAVMVVAQFLLGRPELYLLALVGVVLTGILPNLILMSKEKRLVD